MKKLLPGLLAVLMLMLAAMLVSCEGEPAAGGFMLAEGDWSVASMSDEELRENWEAHIEVSYEWFDGAEELIEAADIVLIGTVTDSVHKWINTSLGSMINLAPYMLYEIEVTRAIKGDIVNGEKMMVRAATNYKDIFTINPMYEVLSVSNERLLILNTFEDREGFAIDDPRFFLSL